MKTNKFITLILSLVAVFAITSCVQDDDYTVPSSLGEEENIALTALLATGTEVSIADVKAMYTGEADIEQIENDIYVKGYVSSSDRTGNFFKEFFIQDKAENPTGALKIIVNQVDTYNQFNIGREVYVSLKGLYIGEERVDNGIITIGGGTETDQYGTTVTSINDIQSGSNLLRSQNTLELVPLNVTFSQINSGYVGLFVQVDTAEFADNLNGEAYFEPSQQYDTQRTMQACEGFDYVEFTLETSGFSDFKEQLLPTGNGSIKAVVNKTFDGANLVLALNSVDDVSMEGARCTLLNINDFTAIISEDFDTATNNTDFDFTDWTNFAEAGGWVWREKVYQGNGYAEFSAYNSSDADNIVWLISPGFDMDAQDNEILNFKVAQHHLDSDDNTLEVFVSTDYDGSNISAATWEPIAATLPNQSSSWYDFVSSGNIDLSSYSGTLHVAFKYTGSGTDTDLDGAYQVDDFVILAN